MHSSFASRLGWSAAALGIAIASWLPASAFAQAGQQQIVSYAAKFVCGVTSPDVDVVKGFYRTAINIHNPHFFPVRFRKKAVEARPERETARGRISPYHREVLGPDEAMYVDCDDIDLLFGIPPSPNRAHWEGFVVLEVIPETGLPRPSLDVVGKYTARPIAGGVSSEDIERVTPKEILAPVPLPGDPPGDVAAAK
jgi:hypothetical protein